jgi:hypothetical protein
MGQRYEILGLPASRNAISLAGFPDFDPVHDFCRPLVLFPGLIVLPGIKLAGHRLNQSLEFQA